MINMISIIDVLLVCAIVNAFGGDLVSTAQYLSIPANEQYQIDNHITTDYHHQYIRPSLVHNNFYDTAAQFTNPTLFLQDAQHSVLDALFSIAENDDYECVPKLLCDFFAGGTGSQLSPALPAASVVGLDLNSLIEWSRIHWVNTSLFGHFGKAAILGYAFKGNPSKCHIAYPQCPNDPNKLNHYLNNHNGGFFRFFRRPANTYAVQFSNYNKPLNYEKNDDHQAEKRIQTKPSIFINANDNYRKAKFNSNQNGIQINHNRIAFPTEQQKNHDYSFNSFDASLMPLLFQKGEKLKFVADNDRVRTGKEIVNANYLNIQKPLPNHVPTFHILPDRTGTGELKLDLEDVEKNYQDSLAYDQNTYVNLLYNSFPNYNNKKEMKPLHFPDE